MIARAENRGLGTLSWEWYRHMKPDRTLVVIPEGVRHAQLTSHLERFPGATVVSFDGALPERGCMEWLDGLDVVYTAETFYDWRFCAWAKELGVATVCHVMPEWFRDQWNVGSSAPTAWWAPTSWRMNRLPEGTRHVPVPIATDRFKPWTPHEGPFRWLHVAGAETHFHRNGTPAVLKAATLLREPQEIVIRSQTRGYDAPREHVTIDYTDLPNYWDGYDGYDAMLMPRRYAGLCLPVLEAFAAGLPVVMTNMSPQASDWPVLLAPTKPGRRIRILASDISTGDVNARSLAKSMDRWASTPRIVATWRERARSYAMANAWSVRAPQIRAELEEVVDRKKKP